MQNGDLLVEVSQQQESSFLGFPPLVRFFRSTGEELFSESVPHFTGPQQRRYSPAGGDLYRCEVVFDAYPGERFYGLGQHQHGLLDQKGAVIELIQRNTEVCIPFALSNRGYGFFWNMAGVGRVELGTNRTRWVADGARQIDYWVTASSSPAELVSRYSKATGLPPMLPEWASGFWQCKLRYRSQHELLEVAREHKRRGLPLAVIVIDYFHWTRQGEWRFDPSEWPDPQAMADELHELGVELMVSIWPTVNPNSDNYAEMDQRGLLVGSGGSLPLHLPFWDKGTKVGPSFAITTRRIPRPVITSGQRSPTVMAGMESGLSGWMLASQRCNLRTPKAPCTTSARAWKCRTSIPASMHVALPKGSGRTARTRCFCSAVRRGQAASATEPQCGQETPTPRSKHLLLRSRPA